MMVHSRKVLAFMTLALFSVALAFAGGGSDASASKSVNPLEPIIA